MASRTVAIRWLPDYAFVGCRIVADYFLEFVRKVTTMPAPTNSSEFLQMLRKSGLVEPRTLDDYLEKQRASNLPIPEEPKQLASLLVRDGLLTFFQGGQLLQGKSKGFTIGKYRVLEQIGSGGMGNVFLCEHTVMKRRVAIKVLPSDRAEDPTSLERFQREAQAVAVLDHPNIVRAHDICQEGKLHFLVMEYVEGVSLYELVHRFGVLGIKRAVGYIYQAAVGLQHAHEAGLVHRDIKPGNILIHRTGLVKLVDLGLALFFHNKTSELTNQDERSVLGTADYLSPEQAMSSHDVDIRADIYSLGATFFFTLTGSPPFGKGSVAQKLLWHQVRPVPSVRQFRDDVPEELDKILTKMLAKNRQDRWQTPLEVAEALQPWISSELIPVSAEELRPLSPAASGQPSSDPRGPSSPIASRTSRDSSSRIAVSKRPNSEQEITTTTKDNRTSPGSSHKFRALGEAKDSGVLKSPSSPVIKQTVPTTSTRDEKRPSHASRVPFLVIVGIAASLSIAFVAVGSILLLKRIGGSSAAAQGSASKESAGTEREGGEESSYPKPGGSASGSASASLGSGQSGQGSIPTVPVVPRRWTVSKSGPPPTVRTIKEALAQAQPGDAIVVADDVQEVVRIEGGARLNGIVLEASESSGKPVIWSAPADLGDGQPLLELLDVSGVRIRGFRFEGRARVAHGVVLGGLCPDLALERLTFAGFRQAAIKFKECRGDKLSPISLKNLAVFGDPASASAVVIETALEGDVHRLRVQNCRFVGPYSTAVVRVSGNVGEVVWERNRFQGAPVGFLFQKATQWKFQSAMVSNTFADLTTAFSWDSLPSHDHPTQLKLYSNLFLRSAKLAHVEKVTVGIKTSVGKWIWFDEGNPVTEASAETRYFRKTFDVDSSLPTKALLHLACDDSCQVWVNGEHVFRHKYSYFNHSVEQIDITRRIRLGKNVIAVQAENLRDPAVGKATPAGLLAHLSMSIDNKSITLGSDETWRTSKTAPVAWVRRDFVDTKWTPAVVLGPYGKALPAWDNLLWETTLSKLSRDGVAPFDMQTLGNIRDQGSNEEYPRFDSRQHELTLPESQASSDSFLLYPTDHFLAHAGQDGIPVGVPPTVEVDSPSSSVVLKKSGGEELPFASVRAALKQAQSGDRVRVLAPFLEEILELTSEFNLDGVVLEGAGADNAPVVWQPPDNTRGRPLLSLQSVAGLQVRNFHIQGRERLEDAIVMRGACPGVVLEDLRLSGFHRSALRLTHCSGTEEQPILLRRLRMETDLPYEQAVLLDGEKNQNINILECRFEGLGRKAVHVEGDLQAVTCTHNRFFLTGSGFYFNKGAADRKIELRLNSNTFYELQSGLYFEQSPGVEGIKITLRNNLFSRVKKISAVQGFTPERTTEAEWIWTDEGTTLLAAPEGERYFRKTFERSAQAATRAVMDAVCDDSCTIWLNGERVGNAELNSTRRVNSFDVTRLLREGKNVLAVKAINKPGSAGLDGKSSSAGLLVQLTCYQGDNVEMAIASNKTWKASKGETEGWERIDFDDSGWAAARSLAPSGKGDSAWQNLVWESVIRAAFGDIPQPLVQTPLGNVRDFASREGFPVTEGKVFGLHVLNTNPAIDSEFLRYAKSSFLFKMGHEAAPVGVPPLK